MKCELLAEQNLALLHDFIDDESTKYFQYISEPDVRIRGQIEGLLSYLLDVRYIHEEH